MKYKYFLFSGVILILVGIGIFLVLGRSDKSESPVSGKEQDSVTDQSDRELEREMKRFEEDQEIGEDTSLSVLENEVDDTIILEENFSDL